MVAHPPELVPNGPLDPNQEPEPYVATTNPWRLGIRIFGLLFLFRFAMVALGMLRVGRLHPIPASICVIYLVCGLGLLRSWNWARILTLWMLPILALNAWLVIVASPQSSHGFPVFMICVFGVLFMYLHLPPVEREFPRARRTRSPRGYITPPPRQIPASLRLSTVLGNRFMIMCWTMPAFIFFGVGIQLKKAGFRFAPGMDWYSAALWGTSWVFFLGVMAWMTGKLARWIIGKELHLLEYGLLAQATLASKKEFHFEQTLYRLHFTYEVGGKTYHSLLDTTTPNLLLDEPREPLLYDPRNPKHSILLDDLPARVDFDDQGLIRHRYAFMGYVYALIPVAILAGMVYWTLK